MLPSVQPLESAHRIWLLDAQLDLTYGVNSIGMKYERMLFGMKISDASCLAKAIHATNTMSSLILQVVTDPNALDANDIPPDRPLYGRRTNVWHSSLSFASCFRPPTGKQKVDQTVYISRDGSSSRLVCSMHDAWIIGLHAGIESLSDHHCESDGVISLLSSSPRGASLAPST